MNRFGFEYATILWLGAPLACALLFLYARSLRRALVPAPRMAALTALRAGALALVLALLARPVWRESFDESHQRDRVALLVDRSASMSLVEDRHSRYAQLLSFARGALVPAVETAKLRVVPFLFAEDANAADGPQLAHAKPVGPATNLGRGIIRALTFSDPPPLAVVALTDGAATTDADNARAMTLLVENRVPFVGIGFGSETNSQLLSLERIIAPSVVAPEQQFRISVQLRATGATSIPGFSLVLMKNGKLVERKAVAATQGPRVWQESFTRTEQQERFHTFTVHLQPPDDPAISCPRKSASATVRVTAERDLRVLFVQGALTWDYKFIRLALAGDPAISFAGLSRTASGSRFFQSVESGSELIGGFPTTMEELTHYRVVILSHLKPTDLTPAQQELLADFCGKYGNGLLMIGGPTTFNTSWAQSRLEQLLPVRFRRFGGASATNQLFRLQPTPAALRHPVFQLGDAGDVRNAWQMVPSFNQYARVDSIKPGAEVWLQKGAAAQPGQAAPLMVVQRYGAGTSAVICVQNFWRWRLGRNAHTEHFDRFWKQLVRFLAEGNLETVTLTVPDQELRTGKAIRLVAEQRPDPRQPTSVARPYDLQIIDQKDVIRVTKRLELRPARPVEATFQVDDEGTYSARLVDLQEVVRANRTLVIHDLALEYLHTSRNMENLRQWASLSSGVALRAEECQDAARLLETLKLQMQQRQEESPRVLPAGINGWILLLLLGCLGGEWTLRKIWSMA